LFHRIKALLDELDEKIGGFGPTSTVEQLTGDRMVRGYPDFL
jgi:hypothetical protein